MSRMIGVAALLAVFLVPALAVPVTYSYTGANYTTTASAHPTTFPAPPWFTTEDYVFGTVTLDIPLGTPATVEMYCNNWVMLCKYPIAVGSTTHARTSAITFTGTQTTPTLNFHAKFTVDEAGDVVTASLSVEDPSPFSRFIWAGPAGSSVFFTVVPPADFESASSSNPGTWVKQSVPEPSALLLVVLGLAGLARLRNSTAPRY